MLSVLFAVILTAQPAAPSLKFETIGSVRHPSNIVGAAITPDSKTAFLARDDKWLLAYSLETGQTRGRRFYGDIQGIALNPQGDRLAVTTGQDLISLVDSKSLNPVTTATIDAGPEHLLFLPDRNSLVTTTGSGHLLKLSSVNLSTILDQFPTKGSRVLGLACSGDGATVATSDKDGNIKLWASYNLALLREWKAHDKFVRSLAFDPSGLFLVSGGEDGVLKVWRTSDFTLVKLLPAYHQQSIRGIAFSTDARMVTVGYDGLCQFWKLGSFEPGKSFTDYRGYMTTCAISADNRWLVRGGNALDVVPMERPTEFSRVAIYGGSILAMAVGPDRKEFVTGGMDKGLYLWKFNGNDVKDISSKAVYLDDWVTAVDFCRRSKSIAAGLVNGAVEIRTASSLSLERSWSAHKGRANGVLAAAAETLVTAGEDSYVRLWNLDGKCLTERPMGAPCRSIASSGGRVAVGTSGGTITVYDGNDLALMHSLKGRPLSITALGFSRTGGELIVGYFDGAIELYDTRTWSSKAFKVGEGSSVLAIEANPSADFFVTGYRNGAVDILSQSSLERFASATSEACEVYSAKWVLEGNTLAAAGASNGVSFQRLGNNSSSSPGSR